VVERVDAGVAELLDAAWEREWPGIHPFLDNREPWDRWVRFHSLAGSKRYADTEAERAEIVRRHTTVLNELLGDDAASGLVVYWAITEGEASESRWPALMPHPRIWHESALWEHDVDEDIHATFFVDTSRRTTEELVGVLQGVADDTLWSVVIAPPSLAWRYHPYDGGADIIMQSSVARDQLAARHHDWLSARPDGM
jgi:hypothetical protein